MTTGRARDGSLELQNDQYRDTVGRGSLAVRGTTVQKLSSREQFSLEERLGKGSERSIAKNLKAAGRGVKQNPYRDGRGKLGGKTEMGLNCCSAGGKKKND